MIRKLMLALSCVSLFILVACGAEMNVEDLMSFVGTDADEFESAVVELDSDNTELDFFIEIISEEEFSDLENFIEIDYAKARGGFVNAGLNLIFHFNQPVTNFTLIDLAFRADATVAKSGIIYEVGDLFPDTPIVLSHYHTQGAVPASGFQFTDPEGVTRWFMLDQSQLDASIVWTPFNWCEDYELFDPETEFNVDDDLDMAFGVGDDDIEFTFSIRRVSDDDLERIENYVLYDYSHGIDDLDFGMNVIFHFNQPVTNFAVISVGFNDFEEENITFVKTKTLLDIGAVSTERPIVLTRYRTAGTLPNSGFMFTDPDDITRWFTFHENQMDGSIMWRPFHWDVNYEPAIWESDYHEVVAGETLVAIAQLYEIPVEVLQMLNDLEDSEYIQIGQRLILPTGQWLINEIAN